MNTHADKKQENKSQPVADVLSQKQSSEESTFQFIDNRPEVVAQRKLQAMANNHSAQQQQTIQKKENNTGLPDNLKTGMENLSGVSLDDVKVHRNSDKPAQLQAHAYAQGSDIHLGAGQEKHLPHEAWHVVQQKQERVKPTMQMKGMVNVNDDIGLESEADVMWAKAVQFHMSDEDKEFSIQLVHNDHQTSVVQCASAFSRYVVERLFLQAGVEMAMLGEGPLSILHGAQAYLTSVIIDDNDWSEAFQAFMFVHRTLLKLGPKYLIVAEAFKKTLLELLMRTEQTERFPQRVIRSLALAIHKSTTKHAAQIEELRKGGSTNSFDSHETDTISLPSKPKKNSWSKETIHERLNASSELDPIPEEELRSIEKWFSENLLSYSRNESGEINRLIIIAKDEQRSYQKLRKSTRPKPKRTRVKEERKESPTFSDSSESELSSEEDNLDTRLAKYPAIMGVTTGRSHVYGIDDDAQFRYLVTGLPYADTYLMLFKKGRLVPRNVNSSSNISGMRKRIRDVHKKILPALLKRDHLFLELTKLNAGLSKGDLRGLPLKKKTEERNSTFIALQELLRTQIRPHVESIVFGSSTSLNPTNEDLLATQEESEARQTIREELLSERVPSVSAEMFQSRVPSGLSTGVGSDTHAEQSLINSQTWGNLLRRLVQTISSNKDRPELISQHSFSTLQLVVNRSTCIGCARELTVELIRFWTAIAKRLKLKSWREAKYIFEDYVHFMIDFPAIYEGSTESSTGFENLGRIVAGLRDAGWQVRVITGVQTKTSSDTTNEEAQKLVSAMASVPMFFVPGWDLTIVCFPIPEALASAVESRGGVLINGIRYVLTEDKQSLTRDSRVQRDSVYKSVVSKFLFLKTGADFKPAAKSEKGMEVDGPQSELAKAYMKSSESSPYDEGLQVMLQTGWVIQNVSGEGMNCLIRAIFTAAGIRYDEIMVTIARHFLTNLNVADNDDMLDLLGVEGDSLIHFMQAQGVIPTGAGLTVHFPGNSMQIVAGNPQLQIWFSGNHFQAIV